MTLFSTLQSSSSLPDDELAESMPRLNHPNPTPPSFYSSTAANHQATSFPSLRRTRPGISTNVNATSNIFSFTDDTLSYSSNTSTYPSNTSTYPSNTSTYPSNTSTYPSNTSTYPSNTSTHPSNTSTYPSNTSTYPSNTSTYPSNTSTYPSNTSTYPSNYDVYTESRSHTVTSHPDPTFPPSYSSTSANPQATSSFRRTRTGTSPNVSAASPTCTTSYGGYTESNVPFNFYDVVIPPTTYEPQSSSGVCNPPSCHGAQHNNTAQGGVDAWYPKTPVTGGNLLPSYPPSMQYPSGYTPYPLQYASPRVPSSSYDLPLSDDLEQPGPSMAHSRQDSGRRRKSRTHHSTSDIFTCRWIVGENTICGFEGPLDAFKVHFRDSHLSGSQDAKNICCWYGCRYRKRSNAAIRGMRRDSVFRHVWETHLERKRVN